MLLLPTWSIIHSRHWKMQIPYLARHCRVLTFDGRGNGRSDRPASGLRGAGVRRRRPGRHGCDGTERATLVSLSLGAQRALILAAEQPDRIAGAVFICPAVPLGKPIAPRSRAAGTRSSTPTRAGRSTTATTGCAITADSWSSSSRRCSRSRTRRSRSRTASAGGWRRRRRRSSRRSSRTSSTSRPRAICAVASAARCS